MYKIVFLTIMAQPQQQQPIRARNWKWHAYVVPNTPSEASSWWQFYCASVTASAASTFDQVTNYRPSDKPILPVIMPPVPSLYDEPESPRARL